MISKRKKKELKKMFSLEFRPNSVDFLDEASLVKARIKCTAQSILCLEGIYGNRCKLTGLEAPTDIYDAATKSYVDTLVSHNFDPLEVCHILNTNQSVSSNTGALIVDGGTGIAKDLFVGGDLHVRAIYTTSDAKLKKNIQALDLQTTNLDKIKAYSYSIDGEKKIGLLAQELVEAKLDKCVHFGVSRLGVDYQSITAILVHELNMLKNRVKTLELQAPC